MSALLARAAALTAVYLLVLTSVEPGDVLVGGLLGIAVAAALRPRGALRGGAPPVGAAVAVFAGLAQTVTEMARGSWRVVRFCLGERNHPGLVEIPRGERSPAQVALWGLITGEAPDEVPVTVDEARDVLIVHLVDARDPGAVRERHRRDYERWQRKAVP